MTKPRKITEEAPERPCYLYHPKLVGPRDKWPRVSGGLPIDWLASGFTHWLPDSVEPPVGAPEDEPESFGDYERSQAITEEMNQVEPTHLHDDLRGRTSPTPAAVEGGTPRTDGQVSTLLDPMGPLYVVPADFARTLERELATLRAELSIRNRELREQCDRADALRARAETAERERDEYHKAINEFADVACPVLGIDRNNGWSYLGDFIEPLRTRLALADELAESLRYFLQVLGSATPDGAIAKERLTRYRAAQSKEGT